MPHNLIFKSEKSHQDFISTFAFPFYAVTFHMNRKNNNKQIDAEEARKEARVSCHASPAMTMWMSVAHVTQGHGDVYAAV